MTTRRVLTLLVAAAAALSGAPAAAQDDTQSVVGQVQRLVVDRTDGSYVDVTMVVPAEGDAVRVQEKDVADLPTGVTARVEVGPVNPANQGVVDPDGGAAVREAVVLAADPTVLADAPVPAPSIVLELAPGAMARTVALVTATLPGQVADAVAPSTLAGEMTSGVSPYWSDSTGGVVSFMPGTQASAGVYTDWGNTSTCLSDQILDFLQWTAERAGVWPTAGYQRHSMAYTPALAACGFAGVGHLASGGSAWINGVTSASGRIGTAAHELGHNLGLHHSDTRYACSTGVDGAAAECSTAEYGDAYDTMGVTVSGDGPLGAAQLDTLGLLGPSSTVDATGPVDVTLAPVGGLTGQRFLRFITGGATYYVEYRGAVGRDADLATARRGCPTGFTPCTYTRFVPGVVVHRVDDTGFGARTYLLRADPATSGWTLPVGGTFTTVDGLVTVAVDSVTASGARVLVNGGVVQPPGGAVYQPVAPVRVLDWVSVGPARTITLTVPGVPAGATAVALNVTAAAVRQTSYVSACAAGTPLTVCRSTSALNPSAMTDTASAVLVALGGPAGNQVTLYNNAGTLSLIADLQGFYITGTATGALYEARVPDRVMDRFFGQREFHTLTLPDIPAGATAVALTFTSSGTSSVSFASVCPADQPPATCTATSTLNPKPGRDVANLAVVKLGGAEMDQVTVYNNAGTTRLIADVNGYFVDSEAAGATAAAYHPSIPVRVLDRLRMSRAFATTFTVPDVPLGATAVVMNLTSTMTAGVSYVSACPGGTLLSVCRATSAFNPMPGIDSSSNVMVQLGGPGGNEVLLYNNGSDMSLIADVLGFFVAGA